MHCAGQIGLRLVSFRFMKAVIGISGEIPENAIGRGTDC
jgi:hypothetical protein